MDYRNNLENLNQNTILYAHGRVDGTMFGSLKNIFESNWYNNKKIIMLLSFQQNIKIQCGKYLVFIEYLKQVIT